MMKKILVAISGASGSSLGLKTLEKIPKEYEKHLIISDSAKIVAIKEENIKIHKNANISATPASGSFGIDVMMITPCSMNTLAKIANGIEDNLITRSAGVVIKENKTLLLGIREMPFSPIHLENMLKLSKIGVIIAPPVIGYYSNQKSLEDMENFIIGKWFDLVNINHNLYKRWDG
jgi:4-hydroxy-3-polyprenylbenzoate decarboxylase